MKLTGIVAARHSFLSASNLVFAALAIALLTPDAIVANDIQTEVASAKTVRTFKNLRIRRPIIITNAGDGSDRLFIASQYGEVFVMSGDPETEDPKKFMDIVKKVTYKDRENEEGFLGFAFHPKYKETGFVYVYYTTRDAPRTSVISRFSVSKDDPDQIDHDSELELMRIKQPFWNHNGGTICFGPDGYLYVGLGDGGAANDPNQNGQNLKTMLGSILRIDVDKKSDGKNYSVPSDNPFVAKQDAVPEIYAYGLRNVWRMSFDRKTGTGWIADVGQNIWEEVNILEKGGNYGWNIRESKHNFEKAPRKPKPNEKFVEPIWEYDHTIGKSITGGVVYRGQKVPELNGMYLFADYVTGYVWGLKYDFDQKKVVRHVVIEGVHKNKEKEKAAPVITFGEAESGEVYFSDVTGRIYTFVK